MKTTIAILLLFGSFAFTLSKRHSNSKFEMIPLMFIKEQRIEMNLQSFQVGVWKTMKLDSDGYLHSSIPEGSDGKFVDVTPIVFTKDGKLMLNIGAFHTGLYGHVLIDSIQNYTTTIGPLQSTEA